MTIKIDIEVIATSVDILPFIVIIILSFFLAYLKQALMVRRIKKRMEYLRWLADVKKEPYLFLNEVEKDIKQFKKNKELIDRLLVEKSTMLVYIGQFDKALTILSQINEEKLNNPVRKMFYMNYILSYFFINENEKANTLLTNQTEFLRKIEDKSNVVDHLANVLFAIADFFNSNINKSQQALEQFLNQEEPTRKKQQNITSWDGFGKIEETKIKAPCTINT